MAVSVDQVRGLTGTLEPDQSIQQRIDSAVSLVGRWLAGYEVRDYEAPGNGSRVILLDCGADSITAISRRLQGGSFEAIDSDCYSFRPPYTIEFMCDVPLHFRITSVVALSDSEVDAMVLQAAAKPDVSPSATMGHHFRAAIGASYA